MIKIKIKESLLNPINNHIKNNQQVIILLLNKKQKILWHKRGHTTESEVARGAGGRGRPTPSQGAAPQDVLPPGGARDARNRVARRRARAVRDQSPYCDRPGLFSRAGHLERRSLPAAFGRRFQSSRKLRKVPSARCLVPCACLVPSGWGGTRCLAERGTRH